MFSVFLIFCYYLPLEKGVVLHLNNSESLLPKDDLCQLRMQIGPAGLEKKLIYKCLTDRQMDDQESSPGELNIAAIQTRIPYLRKLFQV